MATAAAPYGLKPVKKSSNDPWTGATNTYRIQSNYGTAIFNGQPVILASGFITVPSAANMGGASPDRYIGVFMGVSYTDPNTKQLTFRQNYLASTVASDILAYVADDPDLTFQAQVDTAAFDALAVVGAANCYAMSAASGGSATTGNCTLSIAVGSSASTNPWRVIGIATLPDNTNASGFVDALVRINGGFHVMTRAG